MQERVGQTESSLTHPTANAAVRVLDDGRIILQSGDHVVMVLDGKTGGVTISAAFVNIIAGEIKVDGTPIEKGFLFTAAKQAAAGIIDRFGLKKAIRRQ
jgi:hypothetical protein